MTTATPPKQRTITLTGRRPVKIVEAEWPILATASGDSYHGSDYARHQQALSRGECDEYTLIVRQHADGRALVYGILDAAIAAWGQPAGGESIRGGVALEADASPDHLAQAIHLVGTTCHLPAAIIRACLADLPAEEL